jgi:putative DNA primase/helicase
MLRLALNYAEKGRPIFPCDPRTKAPLVPADKDPVTGEPIHGTGGFKKATTDRATIEAWWTEHPNAMVGLPTGELLGAWVLEIDIANKEGNAYTDLATQVAAIEAEIGVKLPPAWRVKTPRGGEHWFYKSDSGYPRNTASIKRGGKKLQGVDVRGNGGYVIASGSTRWDGRKYSVVQPPHAMVMAPPS